jgi:transketolase
MRYDQLIIVEENQKSGGIGSALIEVLSDSYNNGLLPRYPKVSRVAIDDMYLQITGSQRYLQEAAGLIL